MPFSDLSKPLNLTAGFNAQLTRSKLPLPMLAQRDDCYTNSPTHISPQLIFWRCVLYKNSPKPSWLAKQVDVCPVDKSTISFLSSHLYQHLMINELIDKIVGCGKSGVVERFNISH